MILVGVLWSTLRLGFKRISFRLCLGEIAYVLCKLGRRLVIINVSHVMILCSCALSIGKKKTLSFHNRSHSPIAIR